MFVRVKRSVRNHASYEYLQIVESVRVDKSVRQRVLATLGRRDLIVAEGALDGLIRSLARFSERLRVVEKVRSDGVQAHQARAWGPALVFDRLWSEQGLNEILSSLAAERRFRFDTERVSFALALQRLCRPGSDLFGSQWIETVECPGLKGVELQHLYRSVAFLANVREKLEQELFFRDRDLFTQTLDLVFIDTTSTFIWRTEESELFRRGYSRDRRPDQPQAVLCVAVNKSGWPVAWDILPGNTADTVAFTKMIGRLRERFQIGRVIIVADRGMISSSTISLLSDHKTAPFEFILGCRMRRQKEVTDDVLGRAGRYRKVAENLEVKEVDVRGTRYIICRNPEEERKDAQAREAILRHLVEAIEKHGPKSVVGNKGYSRFLRIARGSVSIDAGAVERDARFDGKFVLRTNTDLDADEVARTYKNLWRVERVFREEKSTLDVRPIFHQRDDMATGHIVASFLALRLEIDLQRRLDEKEAIVSWSQLMLDLEQVRAVEITLDGSRYRLRTEMAGTAHHAFAAAGVRPPSAVTLLDPSPPKSGAWKV